MNISYGGTLAFDTTQASSLTIHGTARLFHHGMWQIGTDASPASFDYPQQVLWDGDVQNGIYMHRGTLSWVGKARDARREVVSGTGALQRSTLRRKVNREEHEEVPKRLMRWLWTGSRKLRGLIHRRRAEARMYQM